MRVKFKNYPNTNFTEKRMEDFAQRCLDRSDYDRGALDQTVDNTTQAIGRLLSVLANEDLLNAEEINHILGGKYDDVELVEEE